MTSTDPTPENTSGIPPAAERLTKALVARAAACFNMVEQKEIERKELAERFIEEITPYFTNYVEPKPETVFSEETHKREETGDHVMELKINTNDYAVSSEDIESDPERYPECHISWGYNRDKQVWNGTKPLEVEAVADILEGWGYVVKYVDHGSYVSDEPTSVFITYRLPDEASATLYHKRRG